MKFKYDKPNRRIVSDDPNTWVESCGLERERGQGFVLHWNGKHIGFREPDDPSESVPNGDDTKYVWTVGEVGGNVKGWGQDADQQVYKAQHQRFHDQDELQEALKLIVDAMSVFSGRHESWDSDAIEVHLSEPLKAKIASGELVNDE